jgi:carotenoid isomerooxygenase
VRRQKCLKFIKKALKHFALCRFFSIFKIKPDSTTDNASVTIYPIGEEMYAFTETAKIYKFDPTTLETQERANFARSLKIFFQPAHPIPSPDGGLYSIGVSMYQAVPYYVLFHVENVENKFEKSKVIAKFRPTRRNNPSYIHSFGITENFFILVEQPMTMSANTIVQSIVKRIKFIDCLKWFENDKTYIQLISRKSGEIVHTFETEGFFFFHTINSYEENDQVILDLICYRCPDLMIDGMLMETSLNMGKAKSKLMASRPLRFVLPLKYSADDKVDKNLVTLRGSEAKAYMQTSGTVMCFPELLVDEPCEFGTLNFEKHYAKKYRYFYCSGLDFFSEFPGRLIKVDIETKQTWTWEEENVYPSEALFIPSPTATSEDDGVLVSALLKGGEDTNYAGLLVLDAKTFKELGRCDFKDLPTPVPKTFHGWFLDEKK